MDHDKIIERKRNFKVFFKEEKMIYVHRQGDRFHIGTRILYDELIEVIPHDDLSLVANNYTTHYGADKVIVETVCSLCQRIGHFKDECTYTIDVVGRKIRKN